MKRKRMCSVTEGDWTKAPPGDGGARHHHVISVLTSPAVTRQPARSLASKPWPLRRPAAARATSIPTTRGITSWKPSRGLDSRSAAQTGTQRAAWSGSAGGSCTSRGVRMTVRARPTPRNAVTRRTSPEDASGPSLKCNPTRADGQALHSLAASRSAQAEGRTCFKADPCPRCPTAPMQAPNQSRTPRTR